MAESIGLLILSAAGATGSVTGIGTASALVVADVAISVSTAATVVGTAAIVGASVGLQYALRGNPQLPKPQDGSQALRQAIPPRLRGYGINRLAGYYMMFDSDGGTPAVSYDVIAFHSGRVDSLLELYLSDDLVTTEPSVLNGGAGTCNPQDGAYGVITLQTRLGEVSPAPLDGMISPWDSSHLGRGIAHATMICPGAGNPEAHTNFYPRGRPELSVVALCSPIWDPRDGVQSISNEATWVAKCNPVLELLDYIVRADGGLGQDIDIALPPVTLAQWMAEADLCDELVAKEGGGTEPRYAAHGWYRYDGSPEDIINSMLAACDGWLSEAGDGSLSLVVGVYREPTEPALTQSDIVGISLTCGQPDEQIINVLNVSYTDPSQKYVEAPLGDVRDDTSIAEIGVARPRPLSLTWVQSPTQATRLAERAVSRLNPRRSGTLVTKLIGLRYLGKRWVRLQYPFLADLEDCVIEIQPSPKIDLLAGRVTFTWNLVEPAALLALQ
ncbi:hypothetical protein E4K66_30740 [Bradyrhizobium frederickii]|uniref:Tip attachment protein J domain-containing protein n=1 Tax=Bradyrhizobium frederickii TaxID=2560054 RepID=A0A4Y9KVK4_9BRAD|nr:hypothetical protein [Bradyrhizobium frederickii]TFV34546.1 hypothetical protein E4K66_30740 [Bradyrhizobium frederickii]